MRVTVDDNVVDLAEGSTVLDALRLAGIEIPTLCHDDRLKPIGACRSCLVEIEGVMKPLPSCTLPASDGMRVRTATPALEATRRGVLSMLARGYPPESVAEAPEKTFHRWLRHYDLEPDGSRVGNAVDDSNPYFSFDPEACIKCFRCVRICGEVQGAFVWSVNGRSAETLVLPDGPNLANSSCQSCGACADACPTSALLDKTRMAEGRPEAWTRTTCPYCGVGCELNVGVRDGRIVQVLPVLDAPVNKGHLCVKGRYAHAFVHSEDRVLTPMIRRDDELVPATWDEALAEVATALQATLDRYGPRAVGVLGSARAPNEDNYLAQKFARTVLGTNNVDCCARVCHGPTAAAMKDMLGTGAATNSFNDIERAATILVIGCNPTENHPVVGARIKQAKLNGAKLIVADPRRTELAALADLHLQLRPGTNVPLLNAIAHVLLQEGLADPSFLAGRVDGLEGFESFLADCSPERVERECGVGAEQLRQAARLYSQGPAMCFHGLGMTEHLQGTEGVMCLVNLALLTGNIGEPGSGINPLRGQNNVQGSAHMGCEPGNLTGFVSIDDGADVFAKAWGQPVPREKGLKLMGMLDSASAGGFKALWAIGYDLYFTLADAANTEDALRAMDFIVVQDLFLNETAKRFAHVFLPACSSFEREGTFMNAERRVQRVRQALEPLGESRPDWQIVCDVARAMGHPAGFEFESAEEIWEEVRTVWKPGAGMSYSRLEREGLQWPCPSEDHPGSTILHQQSFPTGRAALKRVEYTPTTESVTEDFPFLLNTGRSLYQFNAGTMTDRTLNHQIRPSDTLDMHPLDAERLGLEEGQPVRVCSRWGEASLPLRIDRRVRQGELFATFHSREVFLNRLTAPVRDRRTGTPQYKVTAVRVERVVPGDALGEIKSRIELR